MKPSLKVRLARLQQARRDFLITESELGITLADLALRADDRVKARRNRKQARTAYNALQRYVPKVALTPQESKEVNSKLRRLKSKLLRLGEKL
jgi:hypothetical protein